MQSRQPASRFRRGATFVSSVVLGAGADDTSRVDHEVGQNHDPIIFAKGKQFAISRIRTLRERAIRMIGAPHPGLWLALEGSVENRACLQGAGQS
jgi:hypothetical protein